MEKRGKNFFVKIGFFHTYHIVFGGLGGGCCLINGFFLVFGVVGGVFQYRSP